MIAFRNQIDLHVDHGTTLNTEWISPASTMIRNVISELVLLWTDGGSGSRARAGGNAEWRCGQEMLELAEGDQDLIDLVKKKLDALPPPATDEKG